jgi:hypothetical protein
MPAGHAWLQREYGIRNPHARRVEGYGENCWGLNACDGPGPVTLNRNGKVRSLRIRRARRALWADGGPFAPWRPFCGEPAVCARVVLPAPSDTSSKFKLHERNLLVTKLV